MIQSEYEHTVVGKTCIHTPDFVFDGKPMVAVESAEEIAIFLALLAKGVPIVIHFLQAGGHTGRPKLSTSHPPVIEATIAEAIQTGKSEISMLIASIPMECAGVALSSWAK